MSLGWFPPCSISSVYEQKTQLKDEVAEHKNVTEVWQIGFGSTQPLKLWLEGELNNMKW